MPPRLETLVEISGESVVQVGASPGAIPEIPGLASIKRRIAQNDVESLSRHRSE